MIKFFTHQDQELAATEDLTHVDIQGYEGLYEIDECGNVYSVCQTTSRRKCIRKPFLNNSGYLRVNLYDKRGKSSKYYIHRLVAQAFIPNPYNYKIVNHIDGNKLNNCVDNLEWCTQSENKKHAVKNELEDSYKCIVDGVVYCSMREASIQIFKKNWQIKELRYKYGDEFDYQGHHVKVVI